MRQVLNLGQFTPFGIWLRENACTKMTITNLDYTMMRVQDEEGRLMLLEEKTNGGNVAAGQAQAFGFLNAILTEANGKEFECGRFGLVTLDYWGFFYFKLPAGKTMPGPGMRLNGNLIDMDQLAAHASFEEKFCDGVFERPLVVAS